MTKPAKPKKSRKGFAAMSPERRREVSAMGGQASSSRGFADNKDLAREAGRKGGQAKKKED